MKRLSAKHVHEGNLDRPPGACAFSVALVSTIVAILGLGAAYIGQVVRPIGFVAFIALNLLSIALVFAQPLVSAIGVTGVLTILLWHARSLGAAPPRQN